MPDRNMLARPAPIVISLVLVALALYWSTVISLFRIWTNTNRPLYSHGLLLVAVSVILLYRRWKRISPDLNPNVQGLIGLVAGSFVWLFAYLGHVQIAQQLSLLAIIGLLLWAVLGYGNAKQLAFPVLLLVFVMPLWGFPIVYLQYLTAHSVAVLLSSTGVTSVLEDVFISIPAGTFEVTPGCSGLAQFIVAIMVAALYSHVNELAFKKAILLTVIAMIVSIVTNTLRIYIVVMAGQLTAMQHYFVTKDHQTLGWALFGVGIFIFLIWANRYIAPRTETASGSAPRATSEPRAPRGSGTPSVGTALRTTTLVIGALAVGPVLGHFYVGQDAPASVLDLAIPKEMGSWRATSVGTSPYRPRFHGADVEYERLYRAPDSANVYLYVAYYARQEQGKEAVYDDNKVYDGRRWKSMGAGTRKVLEQLTVEETRIRSQEGREKIAWQWYYVNGSRTRNDYIAKILNVIGTLQRDPSIAVVVVAVDVNGDEEKARALLADFVSEALEKLERRIDATRSM